MAVEQTSRYPVRARCLLNGSVSNLKAKGAVSMAQLYICNAAFVTLRRGREAWVMPGEIAEAGSWPLEASPGSFMPLAIDYPAPGPDPEAQAQQSPAAEKPEPKVEAAKPEPHHERKAAAHKPARKG